MPKGHATISWTDANDLKLFLTILTVQEVKLDCQKIATAFGKLSPYSRVILS